MRDIEITRQLDVLNQEWWQFYYLETNHALVLIHYRKQRRAKPQNKFSNVEWGDAYSDNRHSEDGIRLKALPLPDDVKAEAVQVFMDSLRVANGFQEARGW